MITLTRLSGSVFALNSDLIERVDSTPDTVITLVDGTKYVVCESLVEVVDAVRLYRGRIIAESARLTEVEDRAEEHRAARPRRLMAVRGPDSRVDDRADWPDRADGAPAHDVRVLEES